MDVAHFLASHPPFDELLPERIEAVANTAEIQHFDSGSVILRQSGEPSRGLYVVQRGAVEVLDGGQLLDLLGEGELFGFFSLLDGDSPTATVRAHEDTTCLLIQAAEADEILGTHAGRAAVLATVRQRLAASTAPIEAPAGPLRPIGTLVRRPAVASDPGMSIAEGADRMVAERASSLLVPMRNGWGIVTDRDLRERVLAGRLSPDAPIERIASFPAKTIGDDALAGEALLEMLQEGVHHFPVVAVDGRIIGVVTATDLMDVARVSPFAIRGDIERASTREDVVGAGRRLPEVVCALVDASSEPVGVGRVVALVVDAMTRRLLELGIERVGAEPPVAWAWLALGSAARHEQALHTDQDHALAYDLEGRGREEIDPYFAELAEFVTAGLESAGIPRCHGDAMAANSALRKPLDGWVAAFKQWMVEPGTSGSILSSIAYDFRRVAGPLEVEPTLDRVIHEARDNPDFLRHLARRALDVRPPTGFRGNLVVQKKGEHEGRLDVKHGGITIVGNLARVVGVRAGVAAKGTLARLKGAVIGGELEQEAADELGEAFRYLWEIRLRHQAAQVRSGEEQDDFVDPATLGVVARRGLRESFSVIVRAQRALAADLGLRPP